MIRRKALIVAAVSVSSLLVIRQAWVSEDAYITLRYVQNALAGHGLVFNVGERVQAYTHPLWLFLLLLGGLLRADLFYWSIGLGVAFHGLTVGLAVNRLARSRNPYFASLLFMATLLCCSSFLDFQTSGLANSLTNFLLLMLALDASVRSDGRLLRAAVWTGLLLLSRLDMFFISVPILAYVFFTDTRALRQRIYRVAIGLLPIIAWEVFSVVYYGFIFPNTAYTKLGTIPIGDAVTRGLIFVVDFFKWEPLPAVMLLVAVVLLLSRGRRVERAAALGVIVYLAYVVMIGGGFMRGRLLLPGLFLAVAAFSMMAAEREIPRNWKAPVLAVLVGLGFLSYLRAESAPGRIPPNGIVNERKYYGPGNTLSGRLGGEKTHKLAARGLHLRNQSRSHPIVLSHRAIGMLGYYAGPRVVVIDELGLADAFIARTENLPPEKQRIGHPEHKIPPEYLKLRLEGVETERWEDPEMQALWKRIEIITRGEIWSLERFRAILRSQ